MTTTKNYDEHMNDCHDDPRIDDGVESLRCECGVVIGFHLTENPDTGVERLSWSETWERTADRVLVCTDPRDNEASDDDCPYPRFTTEADLKWWEIEPDPCDECGQVGCHAVEYCSRATQP